MFSVAIAPPATAIQDKARIPQKCRGECREQCREKGDWRGDCWEQCWEAALFGGREKKSRETALLPAQQSPPQSPFFPALFPELSAALLGDSGFLSPVAGGADCKFSVFCCGGFRVFFHALLLLNSSWTNRGSSAIARWHPMIAV